MLEILNNVSLLRLSEILLLTLLVLEDGYHTLVNTIIF